MNARIWLVTIRRQASKEWTWFVTLSRSTNNSRMGYTTTSTSGTTPDIEYDCKLERNAQSSSSHKRGFHNPLFFQKSPRAKGHAMGLPFDSVRRPEASKTGRMNISGTKKECPNLMLDRPVEFSEQDPFAFAMPQDISRLEAPNFFGNGRKGSV